MSHNYDTQYIAAYLSVMSLTEYNGVSLNMNAKVIYCYFASLRKAGMEIYPSRKHLENMFALKRASVDAALKQLHDSGLVSSKMRFDNSKIYTVEITPMQLEQTQQEVPVEAPQTLSNEVNVPNQPNTIASPVEALTELPTKPEPIEEIEPMSTPEQNKPVENIPGLQDIPETSNLVIPQRYNDYRNRVYPSSYVPHSRHDHYEEEPF